jgi:hypothetical protein
MIKIFDDYFKLEQEIFKYFEYIEDNPHLQITDCREFYWYEDGDSVYYTRVPQESREDIYNDKECYEDEIYRQIHIGAECTMIPCDTHSDTGKFLGIFDNEKEVQGDQ